MTTAVDLATEIRSLQIEIPQEQIDDLRRRIAATRWPTKELVKDRSQGVQLATMQELARYWTTEYDWRTCEARLNALPQFTTEIDGVDIHFIHVRSPHEDALPLIMTHGWPGSVVELLETVGPLTDPTAHGGDAEDAFHLVLPSIPGYGLSGEPRELGWDADRIGVAWAELMSRLGYTRYVAQGGDVGAAVTDAMGRQAPEGLLGIHVNLLALAIGLKDQLPAESEQEREAHKALETFTTDGFGYFLEQYGTIGVTPALRIGDYFTFFFRMILAFGLTFELPVFTFFLVRLGIWDYRFMLRTFRYAVVIILVLAAILTPTPDVINQTLLAGPMLLLYVISIGIAYLWRKPESH
jgi:pimeloyl-ACP methyl ester carboxylesterase